MHSASSGGSGKGVKPSQTTSLTITGGTCFWISSRKPTGPTCWTTYALCWKTKQKWRSSPSTPCRSSVSYTHLRAHETDSYLVCRLLLEKKKKKKKKTKTKQ